MGAGRELYSKKHRMPQIVSESVLISHQSLRDFVSKCLERSNLSPGDAWIVADSLVESNLRGIDSHGVARITHYLNRIRHGSINPRANITFTEISSAIGRVDGDHGLGQLVMQRATKETIRLAQKSGAGWVAVENSSHCGALAYFGLQLARAGMIGLVFTHSDSMVVPYAAKHAFCGTNPICITAPGPEGSIPCLDMATSIVPWNTVKNAAIEGVSIPVHWAVDSAGEPTTHPEKVSAVRPFGEYKGSGLGLMIEILCSFLMGTPYGPDIPAMYGDPSQKRLLGGLVGAIDTRHFRDLEHFHTSIAELGRRWNAQSQSKHEEPVLFPGQPEERTRRRRLESGIPIGVKLYSAFESLSSELKIAKPSPL